MYRVRGWGHTRAAAIHSGAVPPLADTCHVDDVAGLVTVRDSDFYGHVTASGYGALSVQRGRASVVGSNFTLNTLSSGTYGGAFMPMHYKHNTYHDVDKAVYLTLNTLSSGTYGGKHMHIHMH